ncbi:MAG: LPXTG cell wall anchor domain-containing protein, partial [Ruminococcus sp.]|nr:LPXTG cell wall anchor domain-containing protein [Ruminococcus sp.]
YTLIEERAPKGYKVLESEIIVTIDAKILPDEDEEAAQNWTTTAQDAMVSFEVTVDDNDQNVATLIEDGTPLTATLKVMNTSVFDLPGTGGMGTTLIYVAGAAFVALAVALIVVKRRANA